MEIGPLQRVSQGVPVAADVASADGQKALFAACPQPDILVNNNAGPPFRDFRELDRQKILEGVTANMVVGIELIQKVIDSCGRGKAVVLRVHGKSDAFLSGPLELREGVTLVVDKGTTLFETLDPKVLELSPGSCGIVSKDPGRGCKPLISVSHVSGAGVIP